MVIQTLLLSSWIISLIIYQLHRALTFHFFTRSKSSLKAQDKIIHCFFSIVKIVEIFVQKKINRVGSNYASFHYVYWQLVICSSNLLMAHSNLFTVHWKAVTHFCLQPSHWILHLSQFLKYLFSTSEANNFLKKQLSWPNDNLYSEFLTLHHYYFENCKVNTSSKKNESNHCF